MYLTYSHQITFILKRKRISMIVFRLKLKSIIAVQRILLSIIRII